MGKSLVITEFPSMGKYEIGTIPTHRETMTHKKSIVVTFVTTEHYIDKLIRVVRSSAGNLEASTRMRGVLSLYENRKRTWKEKLSILFK